MFLLWLLARRLALLLPTALQVDSSYAILFHQGGVFELTHLCGHPEYLALSFPPNARPSRIWALVDSNPLLPEPAGIFSYFSAFSSSTQCSLKVPTTRGGSQKPATNSSI